MSAARYSSGQKTVDDDGGDAGLGEGPCVYPVSVAGAAVRRLNKDFRPLGFLVVLSLLLLALAVAAATASHVPRG
jgi:hypothetical protein